MSRSIPTLGDIANKNLRPGMPISQGDSWQQYLTIDSLSAKIAQSFKTGAVVI
jgi:hypothetical protein